MEMMSETPLCISTEMVSQMVFSRCTEIVSEVSEMTVSVCREMMPEMAFFICMEIASEVTGSSVSFSIDRDAYGDVSSHLYGGGSSIGEHSIGGDLFHSPPTGDFHKVVSSHHYGDGIMDGIIRSYGNVFGDNTICLC
jgi:hypothetical protein